MTSTIVKAKFKGQRDAQATCSANIWAPRMPMVLGMPSIVNMDNNNLCSIILESWAQYDVTLEWDDILCIMEIEEEELVPLTRAGQELQAQNPPQDAGPSLPKAIQDYGGSPPIHWTGAGWMVKIGGR